MWAAACRLLGYDIMVLGAAAAVAAAADVGVGDVGVFVRCGGCQVREVLSTGLVAAALVH